MRTGQVPDPRDALPGRLGRARMSVSPSVRWLVAGALPTLVVTGLALLPSGVSTTTAALAYVSAVVVAAALEGLPSGLVASALSFLALNFFFTEPRYTFRVDKTDDLVALAVFPLASLVVGTLLSTAIAQRRRAEQREREARLQQGLSTRLLAGEPTQHVLEAFVGSVAEIFGLAGCRVSLELEGVPVVVDTTPPGISLEGAVDLPVVAKDREFGRIVAVPGATRLDARERDVIRTLANQMALALEGIELAAEARRARLDSETHRLQAALFSSVTHDLRTPLTSITASVTSLLDLGATFSPDDHRELLVTIRQGAERLNRLVGNLLYLSRIRAGVVVPATEPVDAEELIEGVVARLSPELEDHPVTLRLREDLPLVAADLVQIDQVITNVLENAAKFSPAGTPIEIAASRWRSEVEIRIVDHGPGIAADERERVFEPFVRDESRAGGGAGLGLSIARAIAEANGGAIHIEGTPGAGTTVVLSLPVWR